MDARRIFAVCGLAAGFGVVVSAPATAVVGPAEVSFRTVRVGNDTEVSVPFTVANGEQIAAARVEGSERLEILEDACAGTPPAGRCEVRVRFAPTSTGPVPATLHVGDAIVRLNAAAYGVGPSLEASPSQLEWSAGPRADGSVDAVRTIRVINRGDEPVRLRRLSIAGRNAASFSLVSSECPGRRLAPGERCETLVRLRSPGGARRAELRIATELPQAPYAVSMRTVADSTAAPPRPMCPCATAPTPNVAGQAWSFGIVRASFASRVVTDVYTSLAARLTVTVYRGSKPVKSTTTSGRVTGQRGVEVRVTLKRGSGYRVRVVAKRPGDERTSWKTLTVR